MCHETELASTTKSHVEWNAKLIKIFFEVSIRKQAHLFEGRAIYIYE